MKLLKPAMIIGIILLIIFTTEYYSLKGLDQILKQQALKNWGRFLYWSLIPLLTVAFFLNYTFNPFEENVKGFHINFLLSSILILILVPKMTLASFHILENILFFLYKQGIALLNEIKHLDLKVERFGFVTHFGMAISSIFFLLILYGFVHGRFYFKVNEQDLCFQDLPPSFQSFKIVQISDLHIGSFHNKEAELKKAVEKINSLQPDLILFTGDLTNNFANEVEPFVNILKSLKAKHGKYSVLGNHDYGMYFKWSSKEKMTQNFQDLLDYHKKTGFDLLMNENREITINNDTINIVGVENWGLPPFPQHGDLNKAMKGVNGNFSVLMSHDPSHWEEQIIEKTNIDLTLSGHTHGMQLGIYTKFLKWSPVKWKYEKWGGLYSHKKQLLYVNVGLGHIGFLGRIGMRPEISLLRLNGKRLK